MRRTGQATASPRPWTLRRRTGQVFLALAALIAVLVAVVTVSAIQFSRAGNDVIYRWEPALSSSQRLLADLVNEETGVRGYLLSRRPPSLEPYSQYRTAEAADAARVADLASSDGEVTRLLAEVVGAARTWEQKVAQPLIRDVGRGKRPDLDALDAGQARFDDIRARAADLTDALRARTEQAQSSGKRAGVVAGVALGLSLTLVAIAGVALWRGLHRWVLGPVDSLGTQTRLVAAGERRRAIVPDGPLEFTGLGLDVEAMRAEIVTQLAISERVTHELQRQGQELERSNADLAQFAYVASHDLSEPLRKVANFCQLLERQYGDQLDDRAKQYIGFAVDGAKRMQVLITDLLALSRVGRTTDRFVPVDLDEALDQATSNLSEPIVGAEATIERLTTLPTVAGDHSLLVSLFENLVGNAVKYRGADVAPVVRIGADHDRETAMWTIMISDNGIGIDPQYAERVFAIFQRLHLRDHYGGTGIGLAMCRRIVEFHGGQIWLDPVLSAQPDTPGATFVFTLPEGRAGAERAR